MNKELILEQLQQGIIEIVGQFTWGSNYTFLVNVAGGSGSLEAVYKPQRGERPLWDFPPQTLARREVAAFLVSEALGWDLVPPTVLRHDAPFGPGSLQQRVGHDPDQHYFTFGEKTREQLRQPALFDLIVNNADRKGGHVLLDDAGKIWLIDHGISFHAEPKLRTVIWDFAGEALPPQLLSDMQRLRTQLKGGSLREELLRYLSPEELSALDERLEYLLADSRFPAPPEGERVTPWPLV
ncbi:MAG: SCO1664 family protein [Anaerolineales bacterium]